MDRGDGRSRPRERGAAPAYGAVESALGYALFYHVVTRATPALVARFSDLLGVSPSLVGLGLAALLWFVLATTALDVARRQLSAIGLLEASRTPNVWARLLPARRGTVANLVLVGLGGALAAWTFAGAVQTAVDVIRWVAALDVGAFVSVAFLRLVVFFVAYSAAAHALDRLVVDGLRALLGE